MTKSQTPPVVIRQWSFVILLLLLTWGLRLCCLETVPPGWRDDELINIHALSGELLKGRFPLYFTGASGHEPLYHYLHAGVHAALGFNVLSGHFLSIALGTLTIALTYSLTWRLFGRATAVLASLALAVSFWSLMYSRTAIRHINLPPLALAVFYVFWRAFMYKSQAASIQSQVLLGLVLGLSLYTYPAARLLPVLLVLFAIYLALFHRDRFNLHWRGLLIALVVMAVLALPLGVAIAQGRTEAAAQGIGADARLDELAVPLRELKAGNPLPLLETTWTTLGMFHTTGDHEWLYNISGRPVFNLLGGALLWAGVALCLYRWRQPRYFFLLLWLGLGLSPAFISTPPASLSHTILAQPVAYILPALIIAKAQSQTLVPRCGCSAGVSNLKSKTLFIVYCSFFILFLTTNAVRDLRDYFITWPQRGMVHLLYRADYRQVAAYLDIHSEITEVAVSSRLLGPWDRLALEVDIQRDDVAVRLFDPERALIWVAEEAPSPLLLTSWPDPASPIKGLLAGGASPEVISPHLTLYALSAIPGSQSSTPNSRFANGLELIGFHWLDETTLLATWRVAAPLDLPPIPVVANPPPPGVYSGPRLAAFVHLLDSDGTLLDDDDGLWVDPLTLRPGDRFVQIHRFALPHDARSYTVELGLYDPLTGERWAVLDAEGRPVADRLLFPGEEGNP